MSWRNTFFLAATLAILAPAAADASFLTGLSADNQLLTFSTNNPGVITNTVSVSGLGDFMLKDIDYRPSTGALYGVGVNVTGQGAIFQINAATGAATSLTLTGAPFTLSGNIGIDFNPVPDALRVVTSGDHNFRVTFATPTTNVNVDGTLAYAVADVNANADPNITTIGYINNFAGAVSTTLYGIDSNLNTLVSQVPPNAGTLNTIGALGFNVSGDSGFEITAGNAAFLADLDNLYSVNLLTGEASLIGQIGVDAPDIIGLAIAPVPEPSALLLLGSGIAGLVAVRRFRIA